MQPKLLLSPAVMKVGREYVAIEWRKNEGFKHWTLKLAAVFELLYYYGVKPNQITIEEPISKYKSRADVYAETEETTFWIECMVRSWSFNYLTKAEKLRKKGYAGRYIIITDYLLSLDKLYLIEFARNMPLYCEVWFVDLSKRRPEVEAAMVKGDEGIYSSPILQIRKSDGKVGDLDMPYEWQRK